MSGMGSGIGSFMEGLAKGAMVRRQMDADEYADRKMQLLEQENARAAERFGLEKERFALDKDKAAADRAWNDKERGHTEESWKLNAPAEAAQRQSTINSAELSGIQLDEAKKNQPLRDLDRQDQTLAKEASIRERQRAAADDELFKRSGAEALQRYNENVDSSIKSVTDASGKQTFSFDGKEFSSRDDAVAAFQSKHPFFNEYVRSPAYNNYINQKIANGDLEGAKKFQEWAKFPGVRKGIDTSGEIIAAVAAGDMNVATKKLQELAANPDYLTLYGWDLKGEQVKSDNKVVGFRLKMTNKETGEEKQQDFTDQGNLQNFIRIVTDPTYAHQNGEEQYKATIAAKAKAVETQIDMLKDKNKSLNVMRQEAIKPAIERLGMGSEFQNASPEQRTQMINKLIEDIYSGQVDSAKTIIPTSANMAPPAARGRGVSR